MTTCSTSLPAQACVKSVSRWTTPVLRNLLLSHSSTIKVYMAGAHETAERSAELPRPETTPHIGVSGNAHGNHLLPCLALPCRTCSDTFQSTMTLNKTTTNVMRFSIPLSPSGTDQATHDSLATSFDVDRVRSRFCTRLVFGVLTPQNIGYSLWLPNYPPKPALSTR